MEYSWEEPDIEVGEVDGTSCTSFTHNTHGTSILLTGKICGSCTILLIMLMEPVYVIGRNMWFLY